MQEQFQESAIPASSVSIMPVPSPALSGATPESVALVVAKIRDKDPKSQEVAVETLLGMGQLGVDALLKAMQEENSLRKRQIWKAIATAISFFVVLVAISALFHTSAITSFMFFPLVFIMNGAVSLAQQKGVLALAKSSDVRAVPFLLEALSYQQLEVKVAARKGLITLLPKMHIEHANLLTEAHRTLLYRYLQKDDSDLQVAILKALEQVGGESSLSAVQRILDDPKHYKSLQLQEAAAECLTYLQIHIGKVQNAQTLLRASQYTEHQDELLRPAYHTDDTPSNELLRPKSKPSNE